MNHHRPYCSQPAENPDKVIRADTRRFSTARQSISYATGLAAICVHRNGVDSMYYVHPDRLGSYTHITDSSRRVIRALHFDPWGNVKSDANWKMFDTTTLSGRLAGSFRFSRGFTGHEHYADLKIINMNGRLYDPVIARFFSPDNFVQAPEFTQSYNRYSYCLNNPLQWVDPSGELFGDYFDQYGVFLGTDGIDDGKIHIINRDFWNQIKDNMSWVGNDGVRMISRDLASDQHGGIFSHKPSEANLPDESVVNIFEHYNQSAYPCIAMERGTSEKSDNGKVVGLTTDHIIKKIMVRIDGNTNFKIIDNYNEIINLLQHEQQHVEDRINKIYVTNSLSEKRAVLRQIQHPTFAKTRSSFQNATYEYGRKYGIKF